MASLPVLPSPKPRCSPVTCLAWTNNPLRVSKHRLESYRARTSRITTTAASAGNKDDDDSFRVDIDELASRLAAEADRMRRAEGGSDNVLNNIENDNEEGYDPQSDLYSAEDKDEAASNFASRPAEIPIVPPPMSQGADVSDLPDTSGKSRRVESEILSLVGDGGFFASDFELLQELGSLSIQEVEAPEEGNPFPMTGQRRQRAAVIAYTASYISGMPFQDPVVTLLKEYLPGATAVACNELQVLKHLTGMPELTEKWHAATALLSANPPVVELLGYFLAGPSERAMELDPQLANYLAQSSSTSPLNEAAIWVVQKWQDMAPLSLYPQTQQTSGIGLGRLFGGASVAMRDRSQMLRAISGEMLRALGYCHDRSVVHGALGSGSFLLSTFNDRDWSRLVVKIDNFGFARRIVVPPEKPSGGTKAGDQGRGLGAGYDLDDETPFALGCRADMRQLAVVLLECIMSALASEGPSEATSGDAVQRLLADVYSWDVEQFRRYILEGDAAAAEFLDAEGQAGWDLIRALVNGKTTATELSQCEFCNV